MKNKNWHKIKIPLVIELTALFVIAETLYYSHIFSSGAPNLALIFDAQGFLYCAHGIQELLNKPFLSQAVNCCLHLLAESERLQVRNMIAGTIGAVDLIHIGPVLPCLLYMAYSLSGKAATANNWQIASFVMMLIQAVTVLVVYFSACLGCGRKTARLAALLSLFSMSMVVNCGRPLSEIPAACCVAIWILSFIIFIKTAGQEPDYSAEKQFRLPAGFKAEQWAAATFFGFSSAILPLVRTNLSLLPLAALCLLPVLYGIKQTRKLLLLAVPFGLALVITLAPWTIFQGIVTGAFTPLVDRYGSYNLYVGFNLDSDGLDVLPGTYVAHPGSFKQTAGETIKQIIGTVQKHPFELADLFLRKLARLVNAPWNDFQVPCLHQSWLVQVCFHQWLMLLCVLGFARELDTAWKNKLRRRLSLVLLLGLITGYQSLNCLFIAMHRYFFPAMPAVIILASMALHFCVFKTGRKNAILLLVSALIPPCLCLTIIHFCNNSLPLLPQLALALDVPFVACFAAAVMAASLLLWALITGRFAQLSKPGKTVLWTIASAASLVAFLSTAHTLKALAYPLCLKSGKQALTVNTYLPRLNGTQRWFMLVDGTNLLQSQPGQFARIALKLNGKNLDQPLRPWLSFDSSSRENYLFETAFAYCSGVELAGIKQWAAVEIPAQLINSGTDNTICLEAQSSDSPAFVMADIWNPGRKYNHQLSFTEFSWSKGFFTDLQGDIRMDEWVKDDSGQSRLQVPFLKPRIYIAAVESNTESGSRAGSKAVEFNLQDVSAGRGAAKQVVLNTVTIPAPENLQSAVPFSFNAMAYTLQGKYRSSQNGTGASVGLVENNPYALGATTQFAPGAPLQMMGKPEWSTFEFTDICPLIVPKDGSAGRLPGAGSRGNSTAMVILSSRSWWDILAYGSYKAKGQVQFASLQLQVKPVIMPDLTKQHCQFFRSKLSSTGSP